MMKVAFFETKPWEEKYLKENLKKHKLKFFNRLTKNNIKKVKDVDAVSVFIYSSITKDVIDNMPKLKLILTRSTGYDHIDLKECKKRKITVCNVPTYGENTVAEHTFALILAISRKIPQSIEKTKKGDFRLDGLRGFDLKDKTIGIIGTGNIGKHVARIAYGFEMKIVAYDINKDKDLCKRYGVRYKSIAELLKISDIITIHLPENKKTHHILNQEKINMIKKGAVLINTSRGSLIDTNAIIKAINSSKISFLGLDVLEGECLIKEEKQLLYPDFTKTCDLKMVLENNILLKQDNVFITPHNAFNSKEALLRILDTTIKNITSFDNKHTINKVKI